MRALISATAAWFQAFRPDSTSSSGKQSRHDPTVPSRLLSAPRSTNARYISPMISRFILCFSGRCLSLPRRNLIHVDDVGRMSLPENSYRAPTAHSLIEFELDVMEA